MSRSISFWIVVLLLASSVAVLTTNITESVSNAAEESELNIRQLNIVDNQGEKKIMLKVNDDGSPIFIMKSDTSSEEIFIGIDNSGAANIRIVSDNATISANRISSEATISISNSKDYGGLIMIKGDDVEDTGLIHIGAESSGISFTSSSGRTAGITLGPRSSILSVSDDSKDNGISLGLAEFGSFLHLSCNQKFLDLDCSDALNGISTSENRDENATATK